MHKIISLALAAGFLAAAPISLLAESESRPASPAEKKITLKIIGTLAKSLPKPLAGFEIQSADKIEAWQNVPKGTENSPLTVMYNTSWINRVLLEQEEKAQLQTATTLKGKMTKSKKSVKLEALAAKQEKLAQEFSAAADKGDLAKIDQLQKQIVVLNQQMADMNQELDKQVNASIGDQPRSKSSIRIRLLTNTFNWSQPAERVLETKTIANHPSFACHDAHATFDDHLVVLVGPWTPETLDATIAWQVNPESVPYTQVQSVIVEITGDLQYARQVAEQINWTMLTALLSK